MIVCANPYQAAVLEQYRARNTAPLSPTLRAQVEQVAKQLYGNMVIIPDGTKLKFVKRNGRYYPSIHTPALSSNRSSDAPVVLNLVGDFGAENDPGGPAATGHPGSSTAVHDLGGTLRRLILSAGLNVWPHPKIPFELSDASLRKAVIDLLIDACAGTFLVRSVPLSDFIFPLEIAAAPEKLRLEIEARAAQFRWPSRRPVHALVLGFPRKIESGHNRIWLDGMQHPLGPEQLIFEGRGRARETLVLGLFRCDCEGGPKLEKAFVSGCYLGRGFLPAEAETERIAAEVLIRVLTHWLPQGFSLRKPLEMQSFGDLVCRPDFKICMESVEIFLEIMGDREHGYVQHTLAKIVAARKAGFLSEGFDLSAAIGSKKFRTACRGLGQWAQCLCVQLSHKAPVYPVARDGFEGFGHALLNPQPFIAVLRRK